MVSSGKYDQSSDAASTIQSDLDQAHTAPPAMPRSEKEILNPTIPEYQPGSRSHRLPVDSPRQGFEPRTFNPYLAQGTPSNDNARQTPTTMPRDKGNHHVFPQNRAYQPSEHSHRVGAGGSTTEPPRSMSMAASTSQRNWHRAQSRSAGPRPAQGKKSSWSKKTQTAPEVFKAVHITADPVPGLVSRNQPQEARAFNGSGHRKQPLREVKVVQSVEHRVDPQNPSHIPCPWDDPLVSDANSFQALRNEDGHSRKQRPLAPRFLSDLNHSVHQGSPAHERETAFTPTNSVRVSDMMESPMSPWVKRRKGGKKKRAFQPRAEAVRQAVVRTNSEEQHQMPPSPAESVKRELTVALETRLNSAQMLVDTDDVLPGNSTDFHGAEVRILRKEVASMSRLLGEHMMISQEKQQGQEQLLRRATDILNALNLATASTEKSAASGANYHPKVRRVTQCPDNNTTDVAEPSQYFSSAIIGACGTASPARTNEGFAARRTRKDDNERSRRAYQPTQSSPNSQVPSSKNIRNLPNPHVTSSSLEESTLFISEGGPTPSATHIRWPESNDQPSIKMTPASSCQQVFIRDSEPSANTTRNSDNDSTPTVVVHAAGVSATGHINIAPSPRFKMIQGPCDNSGVHPSGQREASRATSELPDLDTLLRNSQPLSHDHRPLIAGGSSQSARGSNTIQAASSGNSRNIISPINRTTNSSSKSSKSSHDRNVILALRHKKFGLTDEALPSEGFRDRTSVNNGGSGIFRNRGEYGHHHTPTHVLQNRARPSSGGSQQTSAASARHSFHNQSSDIAMPPPLRSWERQCLCPGLPQYFRDDANVRPSLNTWTGTEDEFLSHCKNIVKCRGHLDDTLATCRQIVEAEHSRMEVSNMQLHEWCALADDTQAETRRNQHFSSQADKGQHRSENISDKAVDDAFDFANAFLEDSTDQQRPSRSCSHGTIPSHVFYQKDMPRPCSRPPPGPLFTVNDISLIGGQGKVERGNKDVNENKKCIVESVAGSSKRLSKKSRTSQHIKTLPTPAPSSSPTESKTPQVDRAKNNQTAQIAGPVNAPGESRTPQTLQFESSQNAALPSKSLPITTKKRKSTTHDNTEATLPSRPSHKPLQGNGQAPKKKKKMENLFTSSSGIEEETHREVRLSSLHDPDTGSSKPLPAPTTPKCHQKSIYRRHGTEPIRSPIVPSPVARIKQAAAHFSKVAKNPRQQHTFMASAVELPAIASASQLPPIMTTIKGTDNEEKTTEKKRKRPKLDRDVPHDDRKADEELIKIGRYERAYIRHQAAPYAFRYDGKLYKEYHYLANEVDAKGEGWTEELAKKLK